MGHILYCGIKTALKCMGQIILPVIALLFLYFCVIVIKSVPVFHQGEKKTNSNISVPSFLWILCFKVFLPLRKSDPIIYDTDARTVNTCHSRIF